MVFGAPVGSNLEGELVMLMDTGYSIFALRDLICRSQFCGLTTFTSTWAGISEVVNLCGQLARSGLR